MPEFLIAPSKVQEAVRNGRESIGFKVRPGDSPIPANLEGQWLGSDESIALGPPFGLGLSMPVHIEGFSPSGRIEHSETNHGIEFSADPPQGATHLRFWAERDASPSIVNLNALALPGRLPSVTPLPFGPDHAQFRFPVFSERFSDQAEFEAKVGELYHWILTCAPFDSPDVQKRFAIDAYFWPTSDPTGHFDTPDQPYSCDPHAPAKAFFGDNGIARRKLAGLMLRDRFGFILINTNVRGGAGGIAEVGYPSWGGLGSCGENDRWEAIATHEIGHALNLADEYLEPKLASRARDDEPNCAWTAVPNEAPWKDLFTEKPATANSIWSTDRQASIGRIAAPDREFVGMFQGARYREDYFRPSLHCLMRSTSVLHFCPVCRSSIRQSLGL